MPENGLERTLVESVSTALAQAVEGMTGDRPSVGIAEMPVDAALPEECTWWLQSLSLASGARIRIGASENTWSSIGNAILKAAGIDDGDRESVRSTFSEILGQTFGGVARDLSGRLGQQVTTASHEESPGPPPDGSAMWELRLSWGGVGPLAILLTADAALRDALADALRTPEPAKTPAPVSASGPDPGEFDVEAIRRSRKMELLLDVELPVSVSFGRAQLLLKDVIKLTTGSIIELNRSVSEPVDVIVNNCVIARGEVVVVEGNFGVRVHEVVSRQERLRTVR